MQSVDELQQPAVGVRASEPAVGRRQDSHAGEAAPVARPLLRRVQPRQRIPKQLPAPSRMKGSGRTRQGRRARSIQISDIQGYN